MSSKGTVLIIGPGFIGGEVLDLLVAESYKVTGFVRRHEHAEQIKKAGGKVVMGDLDDAHKIKHEVQHNDIVIHTATADHLASVEAVLAGIKEKAKENKSTIFM